VLFNFDLFNLAPERLEWEKSLPEKLAPCKDSPGMTRRDKSHLEHEPEICTLVL